MPRRNGWFLTIESESGACARQPVEDQRQVWSFVEKLQPVVPMSSTWYLEFVE